MAGLGLLGATAVLARRWHLTWGATEDETTRPLPGDGILTTADLQATRAIGIDAPAAAVWPWLAQLGQGRGGFYSYDVLENVVARCDIHSASAIVEEWQSVAVGDLVHLHPAVALTVAVVEPGRALVLSGGVPMGPPGGEPVEAPYDFTWAFVVRDDGRGGCRLVVRERYAYTRRWAVAVVEPVEAISFVMTQKMLRTIRRRVEQS